MDEMDISQEIDHCVAYLIQGLGQAGRHSGLTVYCTGLMLPPSRKSVESMAVRVIPLHVGARHQPLHHLFAMVPMKRPKTAAACPVMGDANDGLRNWGLVDHRSRAQALTEEDRSTGTVKGGKCVKTKM